MDTLGGLVFASLGRIPVRGEVVQALAGFEFHIMDADPRRIKRVRIIRKRVAPRRRPGKGDPESVSTGKGLDGSAAVTEPSAVPTNFPER